MLAIYTLPISMLFLDVVSKRKRNGIIVALSVMAVVIVFSFNTNNNDYAAYYEFYNAVSFNNFVYVNNADTSLMFSLTAVIFKLIGFNYDFYRLIMLLLCTLPMIFELKNNIVNCIPGSLKLSYIILPYAAFPLFFDLVQLRFAFSAFFVAGAFLANSDNKKLKSIIYLLIAMLFHNMSVAFLFILFIPYKSTYTKRALRNVFIIIIAIAIVMIFKNQIISLLQQAISRIIIFEEYARKLNHSVKNGYLLYIIYQLSNILFALYQINRIQKVKDSVPDKIIAVNNMNYNFQIISIFLVIFTMININFGRLFRLMYMLNAINFAIVESYIEGKNLFDNSRLRHSWVIKLSISKLVFFAWMAIWIIGETTINGSLVTIFTHVFLEGK